MKQQTKKQPLTAGKPRLFYLDFVRAVALLSILVVHFNATVTGYFTYPSRLFGSVLPFGIYLGDFGSSLFFIVSGAALAYTTPQNITPAAFYKKRARAVYPMFWLAWVGAFSFRFVAKPGYYAGAKAPTLLLTVLGLDNFAVASGWVAQDFACVGEWFLGSILFLYLLFPLLRFALQKSPLATGALVCALCIPVHLMRWDAQLVAIHVPEFLFGMAFVALSKRAKAVSLALAVLLLAVLRGGDGKILCALFSVAAFILLALLAERLAPRGAAQPLTRLCALGSKYSYPVFLLHHIIILRMVEGFDLSVLGRRDTALLFGAYLFFVACAAAGLYKADRFVRAGLHRLLCGAAQ